MLPPDSNEINARLQSIETMMAEGRRSTQRWGWVFLLWGIGPLIAIEWEAHWAFAPWAWPVTTLACVAVNGLVAHLRGRRGQAEPAAFRSVGAVWSCAGFTVLLLAIGAAWSGLAGLPAVYAALFALAAVAHGSSALILRWWPQFLAAFVWWIATVAAFAVPASDLRDLAAAALLLGNVGFGAWLTFQEWRHTHA